MERKKKKFRFRVIQFSFLLSLPGVLNYIPRGKKRAFLPAWAFAYLHPSNHRNKPVWTSSLRKRWSSSDFAIVAFVKFPHWSGWCFQEDICMFIQRLGPFFFFQLSSCSLFFSFLFTFSSLLFSCYFFFFPLKILSIVNILCCFIFHISCMP